MLTRFSACTLSLTLLMALGLTGCDSIPFVDRTPDYKGAKGARPLEVPPDLTSISSTDTYAIPGGSATYSSYAQGQAEQPEEQNKLLPDSHGVHMERAGAQRWLVVNAPAEKVWPQIRDFWEGLGFAVRVENPESGVMETEWVDPSVLKNTEDQGFLDKFQGWLDRLDTVKSRQKFRTRIDRGEQSGTTEIYLSHRSVSDDVPDDGKVRVKTRFGEVENGYAPKDQLTRKQAENARAEAEDIDAELLRRLMVRLGVEEKRSREIVAEVKQQVRAKINTDKSGLSTISLDDEFDRAWRRVGLGLDRIGFVVEDKNRNQGLYYVRYTDVISNDSEEKGAVKKKEKGLLSHLKFWGDDDESDKTDKSPQKVLPKKESESQAADNKADDRTLADRLKFWEAPKDKTKISNGDLYLVKVDTANQGSTVLVVNKDGSADASHGAQSIINMLYNQLK